ncbi:hypothetical protein Acr_07g0006570 [Actinidia rufa]|uniref:Uncharacterized protein n=1 Tax=Actinidia rufa TaxID=165716 RepID=A0A7J0EVQ3_9ERIC|nr:hypothetical protein Acr_07g0006570 [Actinidia rufa]
MAQLRSIKALELFFLVAIIAAAASGQDSGMTPAPAPAPSIDAGSAHSLPVSAAIVLSSVVLSLFALIKH